jgi:hypothetical protein
MRRCLTTCRMDQGHWYRAAFEAGRKQMLKEDAWCAKGKDKYVQILQLAPHSLVADRCRARLSAPSPSRPTSSGRWSPTCCAATSRSTSTRTRCVPIPPLSGWRPTSADEDVLQSVDFDLMARLSNEFRFHVSAIHHATEAYLTPDLLKRYFGGPPAVAQFATHARYKWESWRGSEYAPLILAEAGSKSAPAEPLVAVSVD